MVGWSGVDWSGMGAIGWERTVLMVSGETVGLNCGDC